MPPVTTTTAYAPLTPPPSQPLGVRVRRLFRSRRGLSGLAQWCVDIGAPLLVLVAAFYIGSGFYEGWRTSYRILLGMDHPPVKSIPLLPWTVSLMGWVLVPGLVGGLAGHIIAARISRTGGTSSAMSRPYHAPAALVTSDHMR